MSVASSIPSSQLLRRHAFLAGWFIRRVEALADRGPAVIMVSLGRSGSDERLTTFLAWIPGDATAPAMLAQLPAAIVHGGVGEAELICQLLGVYFIRRRDDRPSLLIGGSGSFHRLDQSESSCPI